MLVPCFWHSLQGRGSGAGKCLYCPACTAHHVLAHSSSVVHIFPSHRHLGSVLPPPPSRVAVACTAAPLGATRCLNSFFACLLKISRGPIHRCTSIPPFSVAGRCVEAGGGRVLFFVGGEQLAWGLCAVVSEHWRHDMCPFPLVMLGGEGVAPCGHATGTRLPCCL